ncbi:hypothetical protein [Methylobacterium sp. CM6257]|jgi:hypothetical protein
MPDEGKARPATAGGRPSRLPGEPAAELIDRMLHPAAPMIVRLTIASRL